MTTQKDNFIGADQVPIALPWVDVVNPGTPRLTLHSNGYAAQSGNATAGAIGLTIRKNDGIYQPTQSATATIKAIAPLLATMNITAATFATGNVTYTYNSFVQTVGSGGIFVNMDIVVSGMQNAGNNGDFAVTAVTGGPASGTFTVANASGVTESGSTGLGKASSDSLCGLSLRTSYGNGTLANCWYLLIGTNSGKAAGSEDSRTYTVEIWKIVAFANTFVFAHATTGAYPDSPGDVYVFSVSGTTVTLTKNGTTITTQTDSNILGGTIGIVTQSISNDSVNNPGNNQTIWGSWIASDGNANIVSGWKPMFGEWGNGASVAVDSGAWTAQGTTFPHPLAITSAGHITDTSGLGASGLVTGRSWANDQASQFTLLSATGNTTMYLTVRIDSTGTLGYRCQWVFTNGTVGGGTFSCANLTTSTTMFSGTITQFTVGDVFRLEIKGATITAYQNGVVLATNTDGSPVASGSPGMLTQNNIVHSYFQADEFVYPVTGTVGAGETVTFTQAGNIRTSAVADGSGFFAVGLPNGTYTVTRQTPPVSLVITVAGQGVQTFTAGGDLGPGYDFKFRL